MTKYRIPIRTNSIPIINTSGMESIIGYLVFTCVAEDREEFLNTLKDIPEIKIEEPRLTKSKS